MLIKNNNIPTSLTTPLAHYRSQFPSKVTLLLLEIASRLPRRMHLHMIIEFLFAKLALADFVLILVRRDAVFSDCIAMAVFDRLGDIGGVGRFVAVPWQICLRRLWRGRASRSWG
jgi:hypothetical protein